MSMPPRPSRDLKGKVAIVTGAGAAGDGLGNGRAIAILLAEDGASVICVDRETELAERTAQMINEEGKGKAVGVKADVTSEADCRVVVETAVARFGRVDILVNNVGVIGPKGDSTVTEVAEWAKAFEINVTSMVLMAKYAVKEMIKNEPAGGIRGSIVNLGSVAGLRGGTPSLFYPTSKGA
ncbi:hypothetical protein Golomagni_08070, partial [Golovinomyces magnicellulatus]